jgi:ubiquinone/menaquinone biosynthesis C-methylase UbiE
MREKKAKKLLNEVNKTYEEIAQEFSNSRNTFGTEFNMFLPYIKANSTIVDLGCGNGRVAGYLDSNAAPKHHYLGIDNSNSLLDIAQKKYPKKQFIYGDFLNLPLENSSTDLLLCIRSFHHIPSSKLREKALEEIKKALKNDGTLIITVWNLYQKKYLLNHIFAFFRWLFTLGSYERNDLKIKWGKKNKRYYHAFTDKEMINLLNKAGFIIIKKTEQKDLIYIAKKK